MATTTKHGTVSLDDVYQPLSLASQPFYGLLDCRRAVESWRIDLDPDFQRDRVWTDEQASKFIGHVLEGGHVQPLVMNCGPGKGWDHAEMIDGKQRVTAAIRWADGEIPALLISGDLVWAKDLNKKWYRKCSMTVGLEFGYVRITRAEALELYIRLNRGGTPHSDAEIDRVRALLAAERAKG